MNEKEAIVKRANELLAEQGKTVSDLDGFGISPEVIRAISLGEPTDMSIEDLDLLCDGLSVSVFKFMNSDLFRKKA